MSELNEELWKEQNETAGEPAGQENAPEMSTAEETPNAGEIPAAEEIPNAGEIPAADIPPAEELHASEEPRPLENDWYGSFADLPGDKREAVYSDAHYEPAGDTTTPPRYYTPPVRQEREKPAKAEKKSPKHGVGLGAVICLCLVCALLGGCLGAGINYRLADSRLDAVEQALEENARIAAEKTGAITVSDQQQSTAVSPVLSVSGAMSPAQIYQQACSQVVGITTTVNTTSFFGSVQTGTISGSGFILSEDGYIVTNYHVIETADASNLPVNVVLYDGTEYEARIVGKEDVNDLAVLKIEATGLTPASFGNSDEIQVGDEIYVVGNPLGELEFSMSTGHVSALNRSITTEEAQDIPMFQLDAAVNPGNSGGPVYNAKGQVVGIVTAKYSDSSVEGLGFAIPSNDALRITEDLVSKGYVTGKAYLGIWIDERYNAMVAQYYNMPLGAYVAEVSSGSAADKAGLEQGDIITALGDTVIESPSELRSAIRRYNAGDSAELTFFRAGESKTVTIVFDEKTPESGAVTP